jgi:hypothetical protein
MKPRSSGKPWDESDDCLRDCQAVCGSLAWSCVVIDDIAATI